MANYKLHPKSGVYDEGGNHIPPIKGSPGWEEYMKWFRLGGIPQPPDLEPVYVPTLEDIKTDKINAINNFANRLRNTFLKGISPYEMAAWPLKEQLARELKDNKSESTLLTIEAQARGISTEELAEKITAKSDLYYVTESLICGICGKHTDYVKSLPIKEDVIAYDYTEGWPAL